MFKVAADLQQPLIGARVFRPGWNIGRDFRAVSDSWFRAARHQAGERGFQLLIGPSAQPCRYSQAPDPIFFPVLDLALGDCDFRPALGNLCYKQRRQSVPLNRLICVLYGGAKVYRSC